MFNNFKSFLSSKLLFILIELILLIHSFVTLRHLTKTAHGARECFGTLPSFCRAVTFKMATKRTERSNSTNTRENGRLNSLDKYETKTVVGIKCVYYFCRLLKAY